MITASRNLTLTLNLDYDRLLAEAPRTTNLPWYPDTIADQSLTTVRHCLADGDSAGELYQQVWMDDLGTYGEVRVGTWELSSPDGSPVTNVWEHVLGNEVDW